VSEQTDGLMFNPEPTTRRRKWSGNAEGRRAIDSAVGRVARGERLFHVVKQSGIPYSVLRRHCVSRGVRTKLLLTERITKDTILNYVTVTNGPLATPCWIWHGRPAKYGKIQKVLAHRFVFELFKGPIPAGLHACHHCDTPGCVNPDHLYAGTDIDNGRDKSVRGRVKRSLTPEQAREVKELMRSGESPTRIAAAFSVDTKTVHEIHKGTIYHHVIGELCT
jgi:hypothetical protein